MAMFKDPPPDPAAPPINEVEPMPLLDAGVSVPIPTDWWLLEPPRPREKKPWPRGANASASRIKLALAGCMARFHARYTDKRKDPTGPAGLVGKLLHGAREDAAMRRLRRGNDSRHIPAMASVDELLFLLEHQLAQLAAEKEDVGEFTPAILNEARELTHVGGPEDYRATFGVEHTITLRVSPGLVVGGFIDKIDLYGQDRSNPVTVLITDYKTTQELPERDELYYDPQPGLYLAWARRNWPYARELIFEIKNLRLRQTMKVHWSPNYDAMHLAQARSAAALWSGGSKVALVDDHCRHCPYREGDKRHPPCAAYEKELARLRGIEHDKGGMGRYDLPELLRVYREAAAGSTMLETRRLDARQAILTKWPAGQKNYRHGDLLAYTSQDRLREFDAPLEFVTELAQATGAPLSTLSRDVLRVSKEKLDDFVAGVKDEETKKKVEAVLERYQSLGLGPKKLTVRRTESMF